MKTRDILVQYIKQSRKRDLAYDAFTVGLVAAMPFAVWFTLGVQSI